MFLTEISDLIVIDEIINEKKYTHFLTHCENRFFTETGFASKIYTSKNIARILYRHKKIPINVCNILQSNHTTKIELSNGQNVSVTLFEGDQYTNNICFHFENYKTTLFYCGHFRNIYGLFKNQLCFDLSRIGIDYLYLNNTRGNAEYLSSVNDIGTKLKQIMKAHPNYKIIISLPNYGYEDLLVNLLLKHKMKIFIGIHQKDILTHLKFDNCLVNNFGDAQLIIRKDVVDMDCIKERFTKKHFITVRIVEYDKEVLHQNFEHIGLYQIHYSPHVSQFELFSLIAFFQPKYLRDIYPEFSGLPKFLKEASLALCSEREEKTHNDSVSETATTKTEGKVDIIENKPNSIILPIPLIENKPKCTQVPSQPEPKLPEVNIHIENNTITARLNNSQYEKPKRRFTNSNESNEIIKPCPRLIAKNMIKELFDEFVDNDNAGDYCMANIHKNINNMHGIAINNSDNSEISKSLLGNEYLFDKTRHDLEYNYHRTPDSIIIPADVQKCNSPRIGSKRLTTMDDKYHIPKEKHRKLLVNSSIKETSVHIPDLKLSLNDAKMKSNTINSLQTHANRKFTVDCSKQKIFKRPILKPIEYINSDEE